MDDLNPVFYTYFTVKGPEKIPHLLPLAWLSGSTVANLAANHIPTGASACVPNDRFTMRGLAGTTASPNDVGGRYSVFGARPLLT